MLHIAASQNWATLEQRVMAYINIDFETVIPDWAHDMTMADIRTKLRTTKCPLERMALAAQLDAALMAYFTREQCRLSIRSWHSDRAFVGTMFNPFTGNSDGS